MKWSTTVSFALAACGVLALAALVTRDRGQTAEEFLHSIEVRRAAKALAGEQLLRELALAQAQAEAEGQQQLALRAQLEHARVLLEIGSFANARAEFEAAASAGGPQAELEHLRIELELRAREPAAGLDLAHAWLREHPDDAQAWSLCGRLQHLQAQGPRDEALETCDKELVIGSAARAGPWVRELCARPAADPRRVALARDLRTLYGTRLESSAERVLGLCDESAKLAAAACESFGRSLELRFDPDTLAEFCEILDEANLGEEALDLLTAASNRPGLRDSQRAASFRLRALVRRQRWTYATRHAAAWLEQHPGTAEFLLEACRACYGILGSPDAPAGRLHDWGVALFGLRTTGFGLAPQFYLGQAFFYVHTPETLAHAYLYLSQAALDDGPELFPGARALAFRQLAECCRALAKPDEEREALEAAVELAPQASGEAWLRLAQLQLAAPHGGFRAPDLRWARGMALLPKRHAELLPRWLEIGAEELRALGIDARGLKQDIQNGLRVRPSNGAAPFELYTLARACIESGELYEGQLLLQDLEEAVPGFPPAIDLRIQLARAGGHVSELAEAAVARLEQSGLDEPTRQLLATLPASAFERVDQRRFVRADPERSGRLAIARSYAARGERSAALRVLLQLPAEQLDPAERLFAARLELESGAAAAAFARLDGVGEELAKTPGALEAWVEAGLRAEKPDILREQLPARIGALEPERARFVALADRLLASGEAALARGALRRLDEAGKSMRGPDVLWRLAACAHALGEPQEFRELCERAAAFDTQGELELLELLALPPEAETEARRAAVQAVRAAGWKAGPLAQAALALLAEEPEALAGALAAAAKAEPSEPLLARFADASAGAGSTRALAGLALALERPALGAEALARIPALAGADAGPWPAWFRARLQRAAGERESEERELRALLGQDPKFVAAWDRLAALRTSAADEGEWPLEVRLERAAALGESAGTPAERDWDRSRRLEREGALAEALEAARAAAAAAPDSGPILRRLGRLALAAGDLQAALAAYRAALPLLAPASGARSTAEMLELIERARAAEPPLLDAEAERSELEALAVLRPADPRVLLAQARNDLETSATDPSFGAERAALRLERFRADQAPRSFEDLAAGSTEGWVRFLLDFDPERARLFLDAELERDPGNIAAWSLLPRCSAAAGRDADALAEVALVQRLAPGVEGLAVYLRVRARGDWTVEGIAQLAERLRQLAPSGASSPADVANEMRAYLNLGPRGVPQALLAGAALAGAGLATAPAALRAEALWMQAVALVARGKDEDLAQARLLAEALDKLVRDPARQPLLAALRGLARAEAPAEGAPKVP